MSVFGKWSRAIENRDADVLIDCLHEDFVFVRHQSGTTMNKSEMADLMRNMMSNAEVVLHNHFCLYENDEVMVDRQIMDYPDGTRESTIGVYQLKDGKVTGLETGATPLSK